MNTLLLQAEYNFIHKHQQVLKAGTELILQNGIGNGGNGEEVKKYYPTGNRSSIISSTLEYVCREWKVNVNYSHINNRGRFLMPREWGREPLYTFMAKERNEGLGGVKAWSVNTEWRSAHQLLKLDLSYGEFYVPLPSLVALNKFGLPSYRQVNFIADAHPKRGLKNFSMQAYLTWKGKMEKQPLPLKNIINKVDMLNYGLILNFHFTK